MIRSIQQAHRSNGLTYYAHTGHLGSTRFASTTARAMYFDMAYAYAPFGETYASSGSPDPSFTTQRQDTVADLYDFPAREYSIQGRWPSPDPAGLAAADPSNPQSWNRDAYVLNDPMDNVDPLGLCPGQPGCPPRNTGPACINPAARANGGCTPSIPCEINSIGCIPFTNDPNAVNCTSFGIDTSCGSLGSGTISVTFTPPCLGPSDSGCPAPYLTTINLGGNGGGSGGGKILGPSGPCTPSVFNPGCRRPTCLEVFSNAAEAADPLNGLVPPLPSGAGIDDGVKTVSTAVAVTRIVSRGLVQPLSSPFVRTALFGGELLANAIVAIPTIYQGFAGLQAEWQARKARTCRTAWQSQ